LGHIGYVYRIINKINGKTYVGQTIKPIAARLNTHFSKYSRCAALKSAIEKYGKENFEIKIISEIKCDSHEDLVSILNESEKSWIAVLKTLAPDGYNLTDGGDRASMNQETRDRITAKHWKPIKCNETGQEWKSVRECSEFFNVKPKQISRVLRGQRKRLKHQFTFSYLARQS
jgi:group I intron endonuclease